MIPKKIHYCWFGRNDLPEKAKKCIASWEKYCPDYEIIQWNEDNFSIDYNTYTRWCYENKQWAFLSDFIRLSVVRKYGGVYFDTDVELIRSIDELVLGEAFYAFETDEYIATGLGFGSEANHVIIKAMEQEYLNLQPNAAGAFTLKTCPQLNTAALLPFGLKRDGSYQCILGATVLPIECMNPYDDATGKLQKTENTYSIHWYSKTWMSWRTILRSKLTKPFHRIFGKDCFQWLKKSKKY